MRKSKLEVARELRGGTKEPKVLNEDAFLELILGGPALPTQHDFITDYVETPPGQEERGWEAAYMGPYGCAKTSTILAKAWLQALYEPGSQILVARQNFNDLKDTTYKRMEEMLARLPPNTLMEREKSPPIKWVIQPIGDSGEYSTFTFMGLSDTLGSYEFHSAFVDEADEVDGDRFNEIRGRCRLKGKSRIICCAFNPPSEDHWLYGECTGLDSRGRPLLGKDGKPRGSGLKLFLPKPLENAVNVRAGYYEDLAQRYPPDMVRRLVLGQWGSTFVGQGVYSSEFKREWHVQDMLAFKPYLPILRFWDFGYRIPVCLWAQVTDEGQLLILREEMGQDIEIRPFAARCKAITATEFAGATAVDFGDPAASQKKDTGSTLAVLTQEGITLRFIRSGIDPGIRAVRLVLSRAIKGTPACLVARRCTITIRGLEGGYHYPDDGVGDPSKPVKDGYYDHFMDALRYGVTNVFGVVSGNSASPASRFGGDDLPDSVEYDPAQDTITNSRGFNPDDWKI